MVKTCMHALPNGIQLECRVSGEPGKPLLLFLHGFPEGAFIWDALLEQFASNYRCVAPNLRGYGHSSQPPNIGDYRAKLLVDDLVALIAVESPGQPAECVIAHDWGGALAWGLANRNPQTLKRLMIINAPHPGAFLRELQNNPEQQAASQYMHFLRRPDAPQLLADDNWQRMLGFFQTTEGAHPHWMTPELAAQYKAHWNLGVHGACMYYSASPLAPPRPDSDGNELHDIRELTLPPEMLGIPVPTHILWGDQDLALHPALLNGLEDWIAQLQIQHLPGASHWLVHEQPDTVRAALTAFLQKHS